MRGAVHAGVRRRIPRSRSRWAVVARLGLAWWFFGNLYESIVDVPQLLVDAQSGRARRILAPGSPVRYYAPTLPLTLAATAATLLCAWPCESPHMWPSKVPTLDRLT